MSVADELHDALALNGVAFGNGRKPADATSRYVVAWFDAGRVTDASLKLRDGWSQVGTFHCYGPTVESAQFAYDALSVAVLSLRGVTVDGRVLMAPEQLTAVPIQRDDNLTPALFDAVSEWRFRTYPA